MILYISEEKVMIVALDFTQIQGTEIAPRADLKGKR